MRLFQDFVRRGLSMPHLMRPTFASSQGKSIPARLLIIDLLDSPLIFTKFWQGFFLIG